MSFENIKKRVSQYYSEKFREHGPKPLGVDWNSIDSQELRFTQLLQVCSLKNKFSIIDYGCGYGAMMDYMIKIGYSFKYYGLDFSDDMINAARGIHAHHPFAVFVTNESLLPRADYTVASGIFNVRLETPPSEWHEYVLTTISKMAELSIKGFSFNVLTRYSDRELMRQDLFYGDPCFLFDYCKREFSKNVALLHDYGLYEFTVIVRK